MKMLRFGVVVLACSALACGSDDGSSGASARGGAASGGAASGGGGTAGGGGASTGGMGSGGSAGAGGVAPMFGWQLDTTYGDGGLAAVGGDEAQDRLVAATMDASDRVVVVGYTPQEVGHMVVGRLTSTGAADPTFGIDGSVVVPLGLHSDARAVALQADGKIVVAGWAFADGVGYTAVVRLEQDGKLDASFGNGTGHVLVPGSLSMSSGGARSVVVQPDGKIVVGTSLQTNMSQVIRLTSAGLLDAGFGTAGVVEVASGIFYKAPFGLALLPDGSIVALSSKAARSILARVTPAGQLDTSFGTFGQVEIFQDYVAMSVHGSNIVLAGDGMARFDLKGVDDGLFEENASYDFVDVKHRADGSIRAIAHNTDSTLRGYTATGVVDTTYGGGDGVADDVLGTQDVRALVMTSAGQDVVVSSTNFGHEPRLTKFQAVGTADPSYAAAPFESSKPADRYLSSTMASDGSVVMLGLQEGYTRDEAYLVKVSAEGALDTGFGVAGIKTMPLAPTRSAMTLQADGAVLVGLDSQVRRYDANGAQDMTYGSNGLAVLPAAFAADMAVDASGRAVIAAIHFSNGIEVHRLDAAGVHDATFGSGGIVNVSSNVDWAELSIDDKDRILVATQLVNTPDLIRLNPDGTFDTTFGVQGKLGLGMDVQQIVADAAGIWLAGTRDCTTGCDRETVVRRLLTDGSRDTGFAVGGTFALPQSSWAPLRANGRGQFGERGVALAVLENGSLLVADPFLVGDREKIRVFRLTPTGSQDMNFGQGGILLLSGAAGSWGAFEAFYPGPGRLLLAGQAFSPQGGTDLGVLRLIELSQ